MTEPNDTAALPDTWDGLLAALRRRFPGQKDSVLFCVHKLTLDANLTLRDFRDEARLHGIPMAGRALHSARVLLGLQTAETPSPKAATAATPPTAVGRPRKQRTPEADDGGASIESKVLAAVRQLQDTASAEAEQLRAAIRQAIAILQHAIG